MWEINYSNEILEWIDGLDNRTKGKILSRLYLLRKFGPRLGRPYADTVKGSIYSNLKELRIKSNKEEVRIFYIIDKTRQVLLLVGRAKNGKKDFYMKMIKKAENIYLEFQRERKNRYEDI